MLFNALKSFVGAKDDSGVYSLALLHLNIVFYAFTFWCTQPVMPYLSKELGADAEMFGYLQTVFSAAQLLGGPIFGRICDVHGAKVALQIAQFGTMLSMLLLGLATNVPLLFISRLPTPAMQAMHSAQAFITDLSAPSKRAEALGRLSLSYGIGMVLGAPFGGTLSKYMSYSSVALVSALILFLFVPLNAMFLPNSRGGQGMPSSAGGGLSFSRVIQLLSEYTELRNLMIYQLLLGVAFGVYHSTFAMAASDRFHLEAQDLGFLHSLGGILGVVTNTLLVGVVTKNVGQRGVITTSTAVLAVSLLAYTQATAWVHLFALCIPMAVASTFIYTVLTVAVTDRVPAADTGTSIGLSHANRSLSGILTPSLGGLLLQRYGFPSIGIVASSIASSAALYVWFVVKHVPPKRD